LNSDRTGGTGRILPISCGYMGGADGS
jgi:hypothetical protein